MPIFISKDGQQSGPYEDHVVIDQLRNGLLSPDDMAIQHGGTEWQRLGDMFPDVSDSLPSTPSPVYVEAAQATVGVTDAAPPAKKGGCLRGGLIGLGLLLLFAGILAGVGSRFIPSTSCDLAESDARKIGKLRSDIDKATHDGDFDKIGPLQLELERELSGAATTQRYCNDDRFRNNAIGIGGAVVGFVGLLMTVIGLFIGRRKS